MNSIIQTFCEKLFYVSLYFRINLNFKNIVHFSDSRAEICFIFRSFFGRWSFKKKCFCDLLTFRPFHVTAGSNRESYFNPFPSKQKIRNPGSKLLPVSKITSISLKSCLQLQEVQFVTVTNTFVFMGEYLIDDGTLLGSKSITYFFFKLVTVANYMLAKCKIYVIFL